MPIVAWYPPTLIAALAAGTRNLGAPSDRLSSVNRRLPDSGASSAVTLTSPSPCAACGSPQENSAPGRCTGTHSVDPETKCLLSMFPQPAWGGNGDNCRCAPPGCVPIVPQNGASGMRMPGAKSANPSASAKVLTYPCGKSSGSSPKPGRNAAQPQSPCRRSSTSTWSVSPGSAPLTLIGPDRL